MAKKIVKQYRDAKGRFVKKEKAEKTYYKIENQYIEQKELKVKKRINTYYKGEGNKFISKKEYEKRKAAGQKAKKGTSIQYRTERGKIVSGDKGRAAEQIAVKEGLRKAEPKGAGVTETFNVFEQGQVEFIVDTFDIRIITANINGDQITLPATLQNIELIESLLHSGASNLLAQNAQQKATSEDEEDEEDESENSPLMVESEVIEDHMHLTYPI